MTHPTYKIDRIEDLLKVPADRRKQCVRELLYALAFIELADAAVSSSGFVWTDDGDLSSTLNPGTEHAVTLEVTQ